MTSVEELSEEAILSEVDYCYRCFMAGAFPEEALRKRGELSPSPKTGDNICDHCQIVELEEGYESPTAEDYRYLKEGLRNLVIYLRDNPEVFEEHSLDISTLGDGQFF